MSDCFCDPIEFAEIPPRTSALKVSATQWPPVVTWKTCEIRPLCRSGRAGWPQSPMQAFPIGGAAVGKWASQASKRQFPELCEAGLGLCEPRLSVWGVSVSGREAVQWEVSRKWVAELLSGKAAPVLSESAHPLPAQLRSSACAQLRLLCVKVSGWWVPPLLSTFVLCVPIAILLLLLLCCGSHGGQLEAEVEPADCSLKSHRVYWSPAVSAARPAARQAARRETLSRMGNWGWWPNGPCGGLSSQRLAKGTSPIQPKSNAQLETAVVCQIVQPSLYWAVKQSDEWKWKTGSNDKSWRSRCHKKWWADFSFPGLGFLGLGGSVSAMGDLRWSSQHGSAAPLAGRGTTILTTKYLRPAKYFKDHPNISRSNQIFQGPTLKLKTIFSSEIMICDQNQVLSSWKLIFRLREGFK